jgi:hypothetical protein
VANNASPIIGHFKDLPARKYSLEPLTAIFFFFKPAHKPIATMATM